MEEHSRKRSAGGSGFSKRGSSLSFRKPKYEDGRRSQYCNRLGCSTRPKSPNYMKGTQLSIQERPKPARTSFHMASKPLGGRTSKSNQASLQDTAQTSSENESSSHPDENQGAELNLITLENIAVASPTDHGLSTESTEPSSSRQRKQIYRKLGAKGQKYPGSSLSCSKSPITTITAGQVTKPSSQYGLQNFSSSSISDGRRNDTGWDKRVPSIRNYPSEGESSLSGVKSTDGILMPQQAPSRSRNRPFSRETSGKARRALGEETRMRFLEQQEDDILSVSRPTNLIIHEAPPESSLRSSSVELRPIFHGSFGRRNIQSRFICSQSEGSSPRGLLGDPNGYRPFNMEGLTEVILALERIGQDDGLSYEQFMVLETNLLLGGLSFHDRHRDMRLDIDNMTYEELVALEEQMGTVSMALSEEALSESIKRSSYVPSNQFSGNAAARGDDEIKCSICQEEYVTEDEVGTLTCDHGYHLDCIQQWLRQKNWCPICKSSAGSHAEETKG